MALDALWGFFSFMGRVRKEFSEVAGCLVLERATGRCREVFGCALVLSTTPEVSA